MAKKAAKKTVKKTAKKGAKKASKPAAKKAAKKAAKRAAKGQSQLGVQPITSVDKISKIEQSLEDILNRVVALENAVFKTSGTALILPQTGDITVERLLEILMRLAEKSEIAPWVRTQELMEGLGIKNPRQTEKIQVIVERAFLQDRIELAEGAQKGGEWLINIRGKSYRRIRKI